MTLLSPPLTPKFPPAPRGRRQTPTGRAHPPSPLASPDAFVLPPPLDTIPDLEIPDAALPPSASAGVAEAPEEALGWRPDMSPDERDAREAWISGGRGRSGLRIVIVTGAPRAERS
jgi:hypothetical protein